MFRNLFSSGKKQPTRQSLEANNQQLERDSNDSFNAMAEFLWVGRETEFQNQPHGLQFRMNERQPFHFGTLIQTLFDIRKQDCASLTINDGEVRIIQGAEAIWSYEFLGHYKRDEEGHYNYLRKGIGDLVNQSVLTLAYRTRDTLENPSASTTHLDGILIIHLQYPDGAKGEVLYIEATFCQPVMKLERAKYGPNAQPKSFAITIAIDYLKEGVLQEAYERRKQKALSQPVTGDQADDMANAAILQFVDKPSIGRNFYWGNRVMTEKRYYDAIVYFENAFYALQANFWEGTQRPEHQGWIYEVAYRIGFCYFELGLYEKACRFLEFCTYWQPDNHKFSIEFINCLVAMKDIRYPMEVDIKIKRLLEKEGDPDPQYYHFLLRRNAYGLIEMGNYDMAEKQLRIILELNPDDKFALNELEYIRKQREKKGEG